ncbi:hypothetical protein MMC10_000796 [Thelotrema lepadinum]|nr:hypothetical protein [Thelotrema lepadinum]
MLEAGFAFAQHHVRYETAQSDLQLTGRDSEAWDNDADADTIINDELDTTALESDSIFNDERLSDSYTHEPSDEAYVKRYFLPYDSSQASELQIRDLEGARPRYEAQSDSKARRPQYPLQRTLIGQNEMIPGQQPGQDVTSPATNGQPEHRILQRLNPAAPQPQYGKQLTRNYQVIRNGDSPRRWRDFDASGRLLEDHRRRSLFSSDQEHKVARSIFGSFQQKPQPQVDAQPASPPRPGPQLARKGQITRTGDNPRAYQDVGQSGRPKGRYRRRSALASDPSTFQSPHELNRRRHENVWPNSTSGSSKSTLDLLAIQVRSFRKSRSSINRLLGRSSPSNDEGNLDYHSPKSSSRPRQDRVSSKNQLIQTDPKRTPKPPKARKSHEAEVSLAGTSKLKTGDVSKEKGTKTDPEETLRPQIRQKPAKVDKEQPAEGLAKVPLGDVSEKKILQPAKLTIRLKPPKVNRKYITDELAKAPLERISEHKQVKKFPTPPATPEFLRYRRIRSIKAFSDKMRLRWNNQMAKGGLPWDREISKNIQQNQILPKSPTHVVKKDLSLSLEFPPPLGERPLSPPFPSEVGSPSMVTTASQTTKSFLKGNHQPPLVSRPSRQAQMFKNSIVAWNRKGNGERPDRSQRKGREPK